MMIWLQLIVQFFPAILQMIVAVEQTLKGIPGPAKKALVLDTVTAAAPAPLPEAHVASVGSLIDTLVGSLNKTGVFTKGTP